MPEALDVVYTVPETAELLKVSRATVYNLIKRGDLEVVKIAADSRVLGRSIRKLLGE